MTFVFIVKQLLNYHKFFKQLIIFTRAGISLLKMNNLYLGLFFPTDYLISFRKPLGSEMCINTAYICSNYTFFWSSYIMSYRNRRLFANTKPEFRYSNG